MKTTNRSNQAGIMIGVLATLLCLTLGVNGSKKLPPPSPEKVPVTDVVTLDRDERLLVEGILTEKARSVLGAQTENIKDAERMLALAIDYYESGAATEIDVLNAQAALVEARGNYVDALWDYSVARATLARAPAEEFGHLKP